MLRRTLCGTLALCGNHLWNALWNAFAGNFVGRFVEKTKLGYIVGEIVGHLAGDLAHRNNILGQFAVVVWEGYEYIILIVPPLPPRCYTGRRLTLPRRETRFPPAAHQATLPASHLFLFHYRQCRRLYCCHN